ncbi:unnamed protein product [Closterium sp. NIES-53]
MNRKKLRQIDVANAFLYVPVDAEIFVELPHGSNAGPNQICQLEKSLYGIKLAKVSGSNPSVCTSGIPVRGGVRGPLQNLHAHLICIGFLQLPHDQGMYRLTKGIDYILLIVYIDNLLYIGSTGALTTWFEGELQKDLTLTVATTVTQYLGLNIQDGDNAIYLSAEKYTDTIAKRFGLTPTAISTPYRYTNGNRKTSVLLKPAGIRDYQRKLGCLLLAAVTCRPNLSYSASQLATYLKKPEAEHMLELDRALHYLVSTPTIGLTYHKTGTTTHKVIGYWYTRRCRVAAGGAAGAGAAEGGAGAGAAGGAAGAGAAGGGAGAGAAEASGGAGAAGGGAGAGATGGAARTGDPKAEGTGSVSVVSGGVVRPRPYYVPLLQQVLGSPPSPSLSPPPVTSQSQLQPASPLPGPSPYSGPTKGLTERREPESRPVSPASRSTSPGRSVRAGHVSRLRLPPVPGTHSMTLRPSTAPQRVPLPSPPASSLPDSPDPESDSLRAASPTVTRFLATAVTDPLFEFSAASALVAQLVDFAAAYRLDYATSLVAESVSVSVCPPSVGGECALGKDVLEDRQEDLECFAAASPHLVSMLLAPEGDPDALDIPTPRSYAEAIEGPYSSQWQAAMDAEMASWKSTGTYVDEVPPPEANIDSGMWIFRVKRPPGSSPAFKARYVARGFSQRQGVDFFHTFSPTPKMTTLRVLLHVAAQRDYELHSLDFSTAFLQGSLHEEIWLRRPPGFTGSFPAGTLWSLRRPVYGLRQAPREWHNTLRMTLAALGFAPSTADPSLFLRTDATLPPFYVLVYVDDLVFATADTEALAHVKSELQERHTCTDLGELTSYLGLRITRDRAQRTSTLTQSHMVQQVLQRFGFTYSSPQSTPLPTGHSLSAPPSDESVEPSGPYPELVGCLMYLMTCTRPDLAYPLSLLARYVAPGRHRKVHWDAAKRVLLYLCSTSGMGLVLGGRARVVLTGHANASWVDDLATQRSSQGYTFSLGSNSVSHFSSVLSSSCEAEIYAGAMAAQELRWLTYLLTDLGEAPRSPPVLYVDNKAMLALCLEHRLEHRTKHIALRYFLARELQQRGQLRLAYMASQANTADVFTKALQLCDHQRFCTVLGLVPTVPPLLTS